MSLTEQLAIVAAEAQNQAQWVLMWACLAALCAILAGFAAAAWCRVMTPVVSWMRNHRLETLWMMPFVICMIWYGATKESGGTVRFPFTDPEKRYLIDAGSYVTNDMVHVAWTRSPVVPSSADFWGAVRPVGNTNDEDWVIFLESDFNHISSPTNIPYIGAQTNDFQFFTTYTPGPSVHTNGVAVVLWQMNYAGETNKFVTFRTGIYTDAIRVSPNATITNGPPLTVTITPMAALAAESEDK